MSGTLFYEHNADLAGRKVEATYELDDRASWSPRRKLFWLLVCSAGSWLLVIAPFLILA